ncbi:ureidoglycolate dehydrogenase [Escherichia coli]|uniref:Ureidoglycolate dehydrogenase n=1 Tax=Escherichia coli TaxID=562 RepID=A0A377KAZ1_ECOLX|nr:ureidoglycolate dehydrogenase [Escherichia coli]
MMMIDVLSGVLLGLPFGRQVSSMYDDLHAGRNLGQLHIVINPNFSPPANYSVNILARPCAN